MQQAQKVKRGWQQTKGYSAPTPTSELQCGGDAATEFGHPKNTVVVIFVVFCYCSRQLVTVRLLLGYCSAAQALSGFYR
jgi:hypothetical protein